MSKRIRTLLYLTAALVAATSSPGLAAKNDVTGACTCKKGGSVVATYSATICVANTHAGCSTAKTTCVSQNQAACMALGGILTQSSKTCSVGSKC